MKYRLLSLTLAVLVSLTLCPLAGAFAEKPAVEFSDHSIQVKNFSYLALNEPIQWTIIDEDGREAVVGIEMTAASRRAGSREARVWYSGYASTVEFYMTVSNNRVTDVYDESISLTGMSYKDASLTHTSTYGKLSFSTSSLGGLITGSCWLKGTVTGTDNEIEITWKM